MRLGLKKKFLSISAIFDPTFKFTGFGGTEYAIKFPANSSSIGSYDILSRVLTLAVT
jgi:hypothetical protein